MSVVKNTSLLPALEATLEEEWMQSLVFSPFHKYVYCIYIWCMYIVCILYEYCVYCMNNLCILYVNCSFLCLYISCSKINVWILWVVMLLMIMPRRVLTCSQSTSAPTTWRRDFSQYGDHHSLISISSLWVAMNELSSVSVYLSLLLSVAMGTSWQASTTRTMTGSNFSFWRTRFWSRTTTATTRTRWQDRVSLQNLLREIESRLASA